MKKGFSIVLASIMAVSLMPFSAFAYTNNRVTGSVTLSNGGTIPSNMTPTLIIEASEDHEENFTFTLILNGAEWDYNDSGTLETGISYTRLGDTRLLISVDVKKFPAKSKDIRIPLYCNLVDAGDISVTINGSNSTVTDGTYTFARYGARGYTIETGTVVSVTSGNVTLDDITITDEVLDVFADGNKFTLKLGNKFQFVNKPTLELSGKYTDRVAFEIDKENPSVAYLKFTKSTGYGTGKIILKGLEIKPTSDSALGDVTLNSNRMGISATIKVAKYSKESSYKTSILIKQFIEGKQPYAAGTAAGDKTLAVKIDGKEKDTVKVQKDGTWTYKYEKLPLSLGEHTFEIGYKQGDKTFTNPTTREFTVTTQKEYAQTKFTLGSDIYESNGYTYNLDASLFLSENGQLMVPVRALANALKLPYNSITWDSVNQISTIQIEGKLVRYEIGNKDVFWVNTVPTQIETPAVFKDNTVFVPYRSFLNAFGIANEDITWDDKTQTLTFKQLIAEY